MILVFGLANYFYFASVETISLQHLAITLLLLFSSFLRLRLFDEIKDYETDLKINPTRPMARGIITRDQVKLVLLVLIVFELLIGLTIGLPVFLMHSLAIGYSLLMYEEFFIGVFLRQHLTTYAVTHTFVSVLLAATAGMAGLMDSAAIYDQTAILFLLSNWMFFNLFEFARKTFSVSEERLGVDTYSSLFGIPLSVGLSLSQVIIGIFLLHLSISQNILPMYFLAGAYFVLSILFVVKRTSAWAKIFRNMSGLYLLLHYIALMVLLGKDLL